MDGIELTEGLARAQLEEHVRTTRWGRRDISEALKIERFEEVGASHVSFQTFLEGRTVRDGEKPHFGGAVSGPEDGVAPDAHTMAVPPIDPFLDQVRTFEVPFTSRVEVCPGCRGSGEVGPCRVCTRRSAVPVKLLACSVCGDTGREPCLRCQRNGRVVRFRELVVDCATRSVTTQIAAEGAPSHLVALAEGATALAVEAPALDAREVLAAGGSAYRGGGALSPRVAAAVESLMASVEVAPGEKLLRQRLVVRAVPIHAASYVWGGRQRRFWVLGANQLVHAPDYPVSWSRVGLAAVGGLAGVATALYVLSL